MEKNGKALLSPPPRPSAYTFHHPVSSDTNASLNSSDPGSENQTGSIAEIPFLSPPATTLRVASSISIFEPFSPRTRSATTREVSSQGMLGCAWLGGWRVCFWESGRRRQRRKVVSEHSSFFYFFLSHSLSRHPSSHLQKNRFSLTHSTHAILFPSGEGLGLE